MPSSPAVPATRSPLGRPAWLRAPRLRRGHVRLVAALLAAAAALAGGWLALRDSSLVAVERVTVSGVSGPDAAAISDVLRTAGQDMTTLHVRPEALEQAVAPFAAVRSVTATPDFPHGLRVSVAQRVPVAVLAGGGRTVAVAGDGTLLPDAPVDGLPLVKLRVAAAGEAVTEPWTLGTVRLLARAPAPLRAKVTTAFHGPDGLAVHLAAGPSVHFGQATRLTAKWAALQAVLVSPRSRGAMSIDVRVPEHPAAAGLEQGAAQIGQPSTTGGG